MKRLPVFVLMVCACGLTATVPAQNIGEFTKISITHGRLDKPAADARQELKVVMIERDIDLSSGSAEISFEGSTGARPVKLIFEKGTSTVTFVRSLSDIGGSASGPIATTMTYQSYDDLGLSDGHDKKNVRLFFTPHFLFVEVGKVDKLHHDVRNALFFVGPPRSVHENYVSSFPEHLVGYNELKAHMQEDCIDTIREKECKDFDVTHFMHFF